jgi:hypothetical protein
MKTQMIVALFAGLLSTAQAQSPVEAESVSINNKGNVEVEVRYIGGCKKHDFVVRRTGGCTRSIPAVCSYSIFDLTSGDYCEAIKYATIELTLSDLSASRGGFIAEFLNPTPGATANDHKSILVPGAE